MDQRDLKERTMQFGLHAFRLCRDDLRAGGFDRHIADQLFRSATSVAANYAAATRARSRREFSAKLGIVAEEAEESVFWLEFAIRSDITRQDAAERLVAEARELLAIFIASQRTVNASIGSRR